MKKERKEQTQDLPNPEEAALEQHIDEMLSPDPPPQPQPNKISVKDLSEEPSAVVKDAPKEPGGPPEVGGKIPAKKPLSIKITHFSDDVGASSAEGHDEPPAKDLNEAIEKTNQQLAEELLPGSPPVSIKVVDAEPEPSVKNDTAQEPVTDSPDGQPQTKEEAETERPVAPEPEIPAEPQQETAQESKPEPDPTPILKSEPVPPAPNVVTAASQEPAAVEQNRSVSESLSDVATNKAVDDIIAEESDRLLEDVGDEGQIVEEAEKMSFFSRLRGIFGLWWENRWARYITLLLLLGLVGGAAMFPVTRYYALNLVGVRGGASVTIIDESTLQPLKNAQVKIADQSAQTDENGKASLRNIKLGATQLVIQKYAFSPLNRHITIGWGSNPLGSFNLTPAGTQYTVTVTDYLSGKPIAKVQASAGQSDAQSDDKGVIKLTMAPGSTETTLQVSLSAIGFRAEQLTLDLAKHQTTNVKLVPANKAVYVSKRNGTYDVYAKYIDGKDEQKVLAGTGNEQSSIVLVPSADGQAVAVVSTRDNQRNSDGFLLSTLTVISMPSNTSKAVTHAEQIFLVGWAGNRLVYVQTASGTSAANPNRQRLMGYDYKTSGNHQLASTNYFNDVMIHGGKIYYAPSSTYQAAGVAVNFFSINPDGSNKQTVLAKETWNAFRIGYDEVALSVANQEWYGLKFGASPSKMSGAPGGLVSRVYVDSPDGSHSLWVDNRDGKGVLISYDTQAKKDATLQTQSGLSIPMYWLNNSTAVYRIKDDKETADYAISTNGGNPQKVADVTNSAGVGKFY